MGFRTFVMDSLCSADVLGGIFFAYGVVTLDAGRSSLTVCFRKGTGLCANYFAAGAAKDLMLVRVATGILVVDGVGMLYFAVRSAAVLTYGLCVAGGRAAVAVLGVCCAALGAGTGVGTCAVIGPPLAPAVARGLFHHSVAVLADSRGGTGGIPGLYAVLCVACCLAYRADLGVGAVAVGRPNVGVAAGAGILISGSPFVLVGFFRQDRCILAVLFRKGPQGHEGQEHTDREKKR